MAVAGGWREHLFEPGKKYRVLKSYAFFGNNLNVGEKLEFESAGYERYDNMSLFRFYTLPKKLFGKPNTVVWHLHDDEPESKVNEYFEMM